MSSPIRITLASRAISWSRASLIACFTLIFRAMVSSFRVDPACFSSVGHVDVGEEVGGRGRRGCLRFLNGAVDQLASLPVDRVELGLAQDTRAHHLGGELLDAVLGGADLLDLSLAPVGLLIALEVAEEADHLAFEE